MENIMLNVLRLAAIYSGLYFVAVSVFIIALFFANVLWKPVCIFFAVVFSFLTFQYFQEKGKDQAKAEVTDLFAQARAKVDSAFASK
jgi:hypothetical protein